MAKLLLGLKANGLRVGVLDADIYGPSMPRMLRIAGRPRSRDGKSLIPMENQQVPLAGAVIVSRPEEIAPLDARKGLNMFKKVDVPVLGIVENMRYFLCPHCGGRSAIFSHGGARAEAARLGAEFLGRGAALPGDP